MDTVIKAILVVIGFEIVGLMLWPSDDDTPVLMTGTGVSETAKPMQEMFDKAGSRTEADFERPKETDWGKSPLQDKGS